MNKIQVNYYKNIKKHFKKTYVSDCKQLLFTFIERALCGSVGIKFPIDSDFLSAFFSYFFFSAIENDVFDTDSNVLEFFFVTKLKKLFSLKICLVLINKNNYFNIYNKLQKHFLHQTSEKIKINKKKL